MALFYVIASSCSWALLDLLRKIAGKRYSPQFLSLVLTLGQLPILFGLSLGESFTGLFHREYIFYVLLIVVLNSFATVAFIRSVTIAPLSETIPMLSLSPVVATLLGFFLKEYLSLLQLLGIALVVVGIFVLNKSVTRDLAQPVQKRNGQRLMFFVASAWGGSLFFDKLALVYTSPSVHAFIVVFLMTGVLSVLHYFCSQPETLTLVTKSRVLIVLPIIATMAYVSQLIAIQEFPIGLFEAIKRAIEMNLALVIGVVFLKEKNSLKKVLSISLLSLGVLLLLSA